MYDIKKNKMYVTLFNFNYFSIFLIYRDIIHTTPQYDEIMVEEYLTGKLPEHITPKIWEDLQFMKDFYYLYIHFGELNSYLISSYEFFQRILKSF